MKSTWLVTILSINCFAFSSKPPKQEPSPVITPTPKPSPIPAQPASPDVSLSACAKYSWKNRGKAPAGYIKGVVEVYKRHACDKPRSLKSESLDALAYYGKEASIVNQYTLLMGLGMRESSGKHCTGRDMSAGWSASHTAETGLYQFSAQTLATDPELKEIYAKYKANPSLCLLSTFSQGVRCSAGDAKTWGDGAMGREFQEFTKACPAFATEYGALLIRLLRKHFGPIGRKEVEFNESCKQLLLSVKGDCNGN